MGVHRSRLGQRALRQQQVAAAGPAGQLGAGPGIAGVHETSLRRDQRERHALRRVRHRERLETDIGVQRERLAVAHVENADREAGIEQPVAVPLSQRAQQLHDAGRAEDHERLAARWLRRVLERVHEHRQLAPMVGMEVREDDVRHLMPRQPELRQPVQRARAAVEQHAQIAPRHPVTGACTTGRRCDCAGADGDEFHTHLPLKTILLNTSNPVALSLARYTPAGNGCPSSARPSHIRRGSQIPPPPPPDEPRP